MAQDLFLIAPLDAEAGTFPARLEAVLATATVSALLVPQGDRDDVAYAALIAALVPLARAADCALLLDDRPDLVRPLQADGVHMTGDIKALRAALAALKPDFIVGSGNLPSRHEAMVRGELDIDYLLFDDAETAGWWAETFEVPSVYLAAGPDDAALAITGTEFVGFADGIWDTPAVLAGFGKHPA